MCLHVYDHNDIYTGENRNQPIRFIKRSPRVYGRSIDANLYISEDMASVECQIVRRFNGKILQRADCELQFTTS